MKMNDSGVSSKERLWAASVEAFENTFAEISPVAKKLVVRALGRKDRHLIGLVEFALDGQTSSEYPFIFKYAFCEKEQDGARIRNLAAAIHLFQSSAFIVDDIFDLATLRYHRETINRKYNVNYAIIAAELLQTVALETVCSELERGKFPNKAIALKTFNETVRDNYLGQYLDLYNGGNPGITTKDYYRMVGLTTGNFLGNLAKFGALLGDKSRSCTENLARFGYYYGMALQVSDDIIDLIQKPSQTGKSFASDLKSRKARLPMIQALRLSRRKDAAMLRHFLAGRRPALRVNDAARLIRKSNALDVCKSIAKRYVKRSLRSIDSVSSSLSRETLRWLSESILVDQELE